MRLVAAALPPLVRVQAASQSRVPSVCSILRKRACAGRLLLGAEGRRRAQVDVGAQGAQLQRAPAFMRRRGNLMQALISLCLPLTPTPRLSYHTFGGCTHPGSRWSTKPRRMEHAEWDGQQDYAAYLDQRYGLGGPAQDEVRSAWGDFARFSPRPRLPAPCPPPQLVNAGGRRLSR